jgi:hypothetical protein
MFSNVCAETPNEASTRWPLPEPGLRRATRQALGDTRSILRPIKKLIFTNPTLVVALHLAAVLDRALPSAPLICTVLLLVVLAIISCIVYYVCADGSGERVPFTKSLGLARRGR